ncbi:MAG: lytic murein transglycosylase [Proteobacteria bacterium]|nr:lytic murein transglycosylase [Pseudomonadota bacterium]MBU4010318.1 lytic murein transglycosylase [Pseudomonadota bacterium]MBU4037437.1 lytic murein transglycosylase [Pseudomonadota bacterium]
MSQFSLYLKRVIYIFCLLWLTTFSSQTKETVRTGLEYDFGPLQEKLVSEGFDEKKLAQIYRDGKINFDMKGVSLFFIHRESNVNYNQYPKALSITGAKLYMKIYDSELSKAEEKYGVDRELITAIILVESKLGKTVGKWPVLNTLSTIASLFDANIRNRLWEYVSGSTLFTLETFEKKAARKSNWAYNELKSLLIYAEKEKIDPLTIKGSYAGAIGIPQFIPSNIIRYAKDGNMDGRVDLSDHADAIASIANFLNKSGWRKGITDKKARWVIRQYNPSSYYVNSILSVTAMLKG